MAGRLSGVAKASFRFAPESSSAQALGLSKGTARYGLPDAYRFEVTLRLGSPSAEKVVFIDAFGREQLMRLEARLTCAVQAAVPAAAVRLDRLDTRLTAAKRQDPDLVLAEMFGRAWLLQVAEQGSGEVHACPINEGAPLKHAKRSASGALQRSYLYLGAAGLAAAAAATWAVHGARDPR